MIDPQQLHALADGELSQEEAKLVMMEIDANPGDQIHYQNILSLKKVISDRHENYTCEKTWKACVGRLNELDKAKRADHYVGKYAWGLCGAFLTLIAIGGTYTRMHTDSLRVGDIPRMSAGFASVGGGNGGPGVVERWLADLHADVPSHIATPLPIINVAQGSYEGHPILRLLMRDGQGDVALLLIPHTKAIAGTQPIPGEQYSVGKIDDLNCIVWNSQDCALVVVGSRGINDLQAIASKIEAR